VETVTGLFGTGMRDKCWSCVNHEPVVVLESWDGLRHYENGDPKFCKKGLDAPSWWKWWCEAYEPLEEVCTSII
jgi:hypothetical protein